MGKWKVMVVVLQVLDYSENREAQGLRIIKMKPNSAQGTKSIRNQTRACHICCICSTTGLLCLALKSSFLNYIIGSKLHGGSTYMFCTYMFLQHRIQAINIVAQANYVIKLSNLFKVFLTHLALYSSINNINIISK